MNDTQWQALKPVDANAFKQARLQAHHALQIVTNAAQASLPPADDDSHTNFGWNHETGALLSHTFPSGAKYGLRLADLTLVEISSDGAKSFFPLSDKTVSEGNSWIAKRSGAEKKAGFTLPYEMPPHPVATGDTFSADAASADLSALSSWFGNSAMVIEKTRSAFSSQAHAISAVRCWPHHFDQAALIALEHRTGENSRSIGCGFSPGDESYSEPYFYVTPWPYPDAGRLTPLPSGHWRTEGFTAGILTASDISGFANQAESVEQFLTAAVTASFKALS